MNSIDIYTGNYISTVRSAGLTEFMYLISKLFDISLSSVIIVLCFAVLIKLFRGKKYAHMFLFSTVLTVFVVYMLKTIFNTERPPQAVFLAFSKSFPSYHATISTVFFTMLMYIFDPVVDFGISQMKSEKAKPNTKIHYRVDNYLKPFWRIIFNSICIIFIFLVSFSRIYLGVHWLSDVVAGVLLGILISYTSIKIFKKKN